MRRIVEPEILDHLPPEDPRAVHSRRDLRRINWLMGNVRLLSGLLRPVFAAPPKKIVELGCGDGTTILALARCLRWSGATIDLVDMRPVISDSTLAEFREIGCETNVIQADLREWMGEAPRSDLIMANLFLHHFADDELRNIFAVLSAKTLAFASCDPRRWRPALLASRFLGLIGCNAVTRHDAVVSIRAGFRDHELSNLWPAVGGFTLTEKPGGYASHLFLARADGPRFGG